MNNGVMENGKVRILRSTVTGVQAVEASTRLAFARHIHDQFGIGVIEQGAQKSLSCRGMVEAGAGDVITVNPGEVHDGMPIGDGGRAWRMLYFEPASIIDAVAHIHEGRSGIVEFRAPVLAGVAVAACFRRLFAVLTTGCSESSAMQREELLLSLLAASMRIKRPACDASVPDAIVRARELIDDDPALPLTLEDLARETGLSRFQVVRAFARATGLTPHAYLMQRRVHLARRLIAQGVPLAQAALDSGFADQSHMTRLFTRQYGMPPRVYAGARN